MSATVEEIKGLDLQNWENFRCFGLLWFVNRILHVFGWKIVLCYPDAEAAKTCEWGEDHVLGAYVCRTQQRGFPPEVDDGGYIDVASYMTKHGKELTQEARKAAE